MVLFSSYIYKFSAGLANENQDLEKLDWKFVCYYSLRDSLRGNSVQFTGSVYVHHSRKYTLFHHCTVRCLSGESKYCACAEPGLTLNNFRRSDCNV